VALYAAGKPAFAADAVARACASAADTGVEEPLEPTNGLAFSTCWRASTESNPGDTMSGVCRTRGRICECDHLGSTSNDPELARSSIAVAASNPDTCCPCELRDRSRVPRSSPNAPPSSPPSLNVTAGGTVPADTGGSAGGAVLADVGAIVGCAIVATTATAVGRTCRCACLLDLWDALGTPTLP